MRNHGNMPAYSNGIWLLSGGNHFDSVLMLLQELDRIIITSKSLHKSSFLTKTPHQMLV